MLRRGDDFGAVAVGTPYMDGRGHYEFFRSFCWLLVGGCEGGDYFLNTDRIRGDLALPHLHNALVKEFLQQTDADTLCLVEDDHTFSQDTLRRLRFNPANWAFDVVVASYVARRGKPVPVGWYMVDPVQNDGYVVQFRNEDVETAGTQAYDGSGLGFVLIRRWLLEAMAEGKDREFFQWFFWWGLSSPDVGFYRKARDLGAKVGIDREVRIGHIGKRIWTFEDFERLREIAESESEGG